MHKYFLSACASLALVLASLAPARAQPTDDQLANDIDEVIVTATRSETARDTHAGNIAVLDTDAITTDYAVDLINLAPGVHAHRGSGQEHLTAIRSPVLVGGAGAGSFLYLEDGIALRAPGFANINGLMDALPAHSARVEIVRGPGSALHGSNALHGLINFISRAADVNETRIAARFGSYGRHQIAASQAVNNGGVAYRGSVSLAGETEGWRDDQGYARQAVRVQTTWEGDRNSYRAALSGVNLNQETAGYAASYTDSMTAETNNNPDAFRDARALRGHIRLDRQLANGAALSVTPYFRSNDMDFRMHFLPTTPLEENTHQSLGAQIAYARSAPRVTYVVGVDTDLTQGTLTETQTAEADQYVNYLPGTHYDYEVTASIVAPFVHLVLNTQSPTKITAGMRYEMTEYDYTNNTETGRQGKLYRPSDTTLDFADLSPKLGLTHRFAAGGTGFVKLARAARAPQTTDLFRLRDGDKAGPLTPDPTAIDSETLDSAEIGYRFRNATLAFEFAIFAMRKENVHFRDGADYYESDGKTRHAGLELGFDWRANARWSVTASASYADHRYDFTRDVAGSNEAESITSGDAIDGAPETLGTLAVSYRTGELHTRLSLEHVGAYYMDASNTAKYGGHDIADLNLAWTLSPRATLDLDIANLFDTAYATRADKWFGNERFFPGAPRHVMLGYKISY